MTELSKSEELLFSSLGTFETLDFFPITDAKFIDRKTIGLLQEKRSDLENNNEFTPEKKRAVLEKVFEPSLLAEADFLYRHLNGSQDSNTEPDMVQVTNHDIVKNVIFEIVYCASKIGKNKYGKSFYEAFCVQSNQLKRDLSNLLGNVLYDYLEHFILLDQLAKPKNLNYQLELDKSRMVATRFERHMRSNGWSAIFDRYPMIYRLTIHLVRSWVSQVRELQLRLLKDRAELQAVIGKNQTVPDLYSCTIEPRSDRHFEGRRTLIIRQNLGENVVYKPRSLKSDVAWDSLLKMLNEELDGICLPTLRLASARGHGWMEYSPPETDLRNVGSLDVFFQNTGAIFALAYLLNSTDFHFENIHICRNGPMVIDTETLMQPQLAFEAGIERNLEKPRVTAFQKAMLINARVPAVEGGSKLVGGFDQLESKYFDAEQIFCWNGSLLNNLDRLLLGFEKTMNWMSTNGEKLLVSQEFLGLCNCFYRVVLLSTQSYDVVIRKALHSSELNDGKKWGQDIKKLGDPFINHLSDGALFNLLISQEKSLSMLDIPHFRVHGKSKIIKDQKGKTIGIPVINSAYYVSKKRILSIDGATIESLKSDIVHNINSSTR